MHHNQQASSIEGNPNYLRAGHADDGLNHSEDFLKGHIGSIAPNDHVLPFPSNVLGQPRYPSNNIPEANLYHSGVYSTHNGVRSHHSAQGGLDLGPLDIYGLSHALFLNQQYPYQLSANEMYTHAIFNLTDNFSRCQVTCKIAKFG